MFSIVQKKTNKTSLNDIKIARERLTRLKERLANRKGRRTKARRANSGRSGPANRSKTNVTEAVRGPRVLASRSCSVEAEGGPEHPDREGGGRLHATGVTGYVGNLSTQGSDLLRGKMSKFSLDTLVCTPSCWGCEPRSRHEEAGSYAGSRRRALRALKHWSYAGENRLRSYGGGLGTK